MMFFSNKDVCHDIFIYAFLMYCLYNLEKCFAYKNKFWKSLVYMLLEAEPSSGHLKVVRKHLFRINSRELFTITYLLLFNILKYKYCF